MKANKIQTLLDQSDGHGVVLMTGFDDCVVGLLER